MIMKITENVDEKKSYESFVNEVYKKLSDCSMETCNGDKIQTSLRFLDRKWNVTPEGGYSEISGDCRALIDAKAQFREATVDMQYIYCDYVIGKITEEDAVDRMKDEIEKNMDMHIRIHKELEDAGIEVPEL